LLIAGLWSFRKQSCGLHDLSGLAVTALRNLLSDPSPLHWMRVVG
jgi:hypothetical protein